MQNALCVVIHEVFECTNAVSRVTHTRGTDTTDTDVQFQEPQDTTALCSLQKSVGTFSEAEETMLQV